MKEKNINVFKESKELRTRPMNEVEIEYRLTITKDAIVNSIKITLVVLKSIKSTRASVKMQLQREMSHGIPF